MNYGRSQCALHHSILSFVKLCIDMIYKDNMDGLFVTSYFSLVTTPGSK